MRTGKVRLANIGVELAIRWEGGGGTFSHRGFKIACSSGRRQSDSVVVGELTLKRRPMILDYECNRQSNCEQGSQPAPWYEEVIRSQINQTGDDRRDVDYVPVPGTEPVTYCNNIPRQGRSSSSTVTHTSYNWPQYFLNPLNFLDTKCFVIKLIKFCKRNMKYKHIFYICCFFDQFQSFI